MDIILKQRLIGAIVLISLGVIFIPMLLTGKGDLSSGNMTSNIPPEPDYQLQKPAIIVPAPLASVNPPKAGSAEVHQQTTITPTTELAQKTQTETPATPKTVTPSANSNTTQSQSNASQNSQTSNKKAGQDSTQIKTQVVATKQVTPAKPAASTASKPATPKPSTISETPVVSKPSVKPAPAVSGWVVQVGSFEQRINANQLRDKLRHKGYAAFVEPRTDNHSKVYRVRVGPELKRPLAESLQKKLLKHEKLKGIVMQYPAQDG